MVGVKAAMPGVRYLPEPILAHYASEGVLTESTLVDGLAAAVARWPERVALSEPGVAVTYSEFDTITDRVAAAFVRLGLRPLDRVLFQVINSKELIYAFIGCLKAGLVPICTLAAHRAVEIGQIGRRAEARAHIVTDASAGFDLVGFALGMREQLPSVAHVIAVGGDAGRADGALSFEDLWSGEDLVAAERTVREIRASLDPYQVCLFQLSGGTSGTPKIIPRFHNEYRYAVEQVATFLGLDETVVSFTPNPMLHNSPMACFWMPALLIGGEVAIAPSPDISAIAAVINERHPTWAIIAPVHLKRLKETGALDEQAFADIYGLACGNGALELAEVVGAPFFPVYGMTEGLLCFGRRGDSRRAVGTTVGRSSCPYDEIRIVEPGTQEDVPPGGVGELIVRGPSVIAGYYFADELDASFTSDGYYRSGDLMRWRIVDGLPYLAFEGRTKDVVDRGGEKINCSEIEQAVVGHPQVEAVMCVAMPDRIYGEKMCAFVIPAAGEEPVGVADLADHLGKMGFAKFKYPERVEIVGSFPLTASGKPSKPMLREIVAGKIRTEEAAT